VPGILFCGREKEKNKGMKTAKSEAIAYKQNYDAIFKWMANIFTGKTLEVLGIQTGKIVEVRGLEPITLQVKVERIDLLLKDDQENYYHLEEERHLKRSDILRFATQNFLISEQIKSEKLTTVIIASGEVTPNICIKTSSGFFTPVVINLDERDGEKKLAEIKQQERPNIVELVFLPMYGVRSGKREEFTREIISFARQLREQKKIPLEFLAAIMVICNKIIPPEILHEIWKEIRMLKVFEYAEEVGRKEGRKEGKEEGKTKKAQEITIEMLKDGMNIKQIAKFTKLPEEEVLKLKKELDENKK
jgi:hypothetical protein